MTILNSSEKSVKIFSYIGKIFDYVSQFCFSPESIKIKGLASGSSEVLILKEQVLGFPGGAVGKNPPINAGCTGSMPGPGRSHMPWSN